jgi:hypothetical protein
LGRFLLLCSFFKLLVLSCFSVSSIIIYFKALRDALLFVGVGIDGGKDSLSMAATVAMRKRKDSQSSDGAAAAAAAATTTTTTNTTTDKTESSSPPSPPSLFVETVKAPGMLTLTAYCTCPDHTLTITPDLKIPGRSVLVYVDLGSLFQRRRRRRRLGGTALAQVFLWCLKESVGFSVVGGSGELESYVGEAHVSVLNLVPINQLTNSFINSFIYLFTGVCPVGR